MENVNEMHNKVDNNKSGIEKIIKNLDRRQSKKMDSIDKSITQYWTETEVKDYVNELL